MRRTRWQLRGKENKEQEGWQERRLELAERCIKPVKSYKKGEMIALIFLGVNLGHFCEEQNERIRGRVRPYFQTIAKHRQWAGKHLDHKKVVARGLYKRGEIQHSVYGGQNAKEMLTMGRR